MATTIRMPEVLAGSSEAAINSWLVSAGDVVEAGVPLAEVETEKATVEFPVEVAGTVLELLVAEGETVAVGTPIALVGAPGEAVPAGGADDGDGAGASGGGRSGEPGGAEPAAEAQAPEPETADEPGESPAAGTPTELPGGDGAAGGPDATAGRGAAAGPRGRAAGGADDQRRFSSPLVRRLARERGLDLASVRGTGPGGRIVRRDLDRLPEAAPATAPAEPARPAAPSAPAVSTPAPSAAPASPAASSPGYEEVALSGMRKAIARRLTESKSTVPHFYVSADVRMDALLDLRRRVNADTGDGAVRASVNDFLVKAMAAAFTRVPEANATWAETAVRRWSSVDVAIAVAVDDGLLTPVLRGVESLSLGGVSRGAADLVARARAGRLRQHELEGGTSTISNLGMYGVKEFSAILNPPQAAILAVGAAAPRPVAEDGQVVVRSVMTATLSADHRVLDGALAARWLAAFVEVVENPLRILL